MRATSRSFRGWRGGRRYAPERRGRGAEARNRASAPRIDTPPDRVYGATMSEAHSHGEPLPPSSGKTEFEPIVLTEQAVKKVRSAMQKEGAGPEKALRLGVVGGGCSGFS